MAHETASERGRWPRTAGDVFVSLVTLATLLGSWFILESTAMLGWIASAVNLLIAGLWFLWRFRYEDRTIPQGGWAIWAVLFATMASGLAMQWSDSGVTVWTLVFWAFPLASAWVWLTMRFAITAATLALLNASSLVAVVIILGEMVAVPRQSFVAPLLASMVLVLAGWLRPRWTQVKTLDALPKLYSEAALAETEPSESPGGAPRDERIETITPAEEAARRIETLAHSTEEALRHVLAKDEDDSTPMLDLIRAQAGSGVLRLGGDLEGLMSRLDGPVSWQELVQAIVARLMLRSEKGDAVDVFLKDEETYQLVSLHHQVLRGMGRLREDVPATLNAFRPSVQALGGQLDMKIRQGTAEDTILVTVTVPRPARTETLSA